MTLPAELLRRLQGTGVGARLVRGALSASAASILGMGLSFVCQVLVARLTGKEEYGVYAYVLSWLNIVVFYAKFGIDSAAVRFISQYRATEAWSHLRGFARHGQMLVVLLGTGLGLAGAAVLSAFGERLSPGTARAFWVLLPLLPVTALLLVQGDLIQGLGKVFAAQAPNQLVRPVILLVLLAAWLVARAGHQTASTALEFNLLASLVALACSTWLLRTALPAAVLDSAPEYRRAEWHAVFRSLILLSTFQLISSQNTGVFLVGTLTGTTDAGLYAAANQLSLPLNLTLQAVLFVAAPMIAELYATKNAPGLARVVQLASMATAAVAVPVFLLFVVLGRPLLDLYGKGFRAGYPVLVVLGAANLVSAWGGGLAGWLLTMTEHEQQGVKIVAVSALLNVCVAVALIPRYGMLGAAIGTLVATLVRTVWMARFARRTLGVSVWPTWRGLFSRA